MQPLVKTGFSPLLYLYPRPSNGLLTDQSFPIRDASQLSHAILLSQIFFLLSDFLSWVDSGRGNLTWDPNLKWEMGALNGFFSFLFCYCPMEFGALTISNFLIFFSQTYELNICRVKAKSPGDLTNPRSFLFSVRFSVVFLRESTGYQLASRSRDKYALPNE